MEDLVTTPPIPSKETGDRQTRPSRFLLGFGGQEKVIPQRTAFSIRDDMNESGLVAVHDDGGVTAEDATLASAPESGFPLANSP